MKIGLKFTATMIIVSMLVLGSVSITLLIQARNYIMRFSHERGMATAREYARLFGGYFVSYWYTAQTTARLLEQHGSIDAAERRYFLNRTLEGIVAGNPTIFAIWTIWEPDALDDNDAFHLARRTEGTNSAGRFAPYWYRVGGHIRVRTLNDFGLPGQDDDYYEMARRSMP
ncbi:MAG: hypothetical protein FWD87_10150, partial [Spirochaetaceae bacterium]|nr:hypothetical protein [Spirochaetaceae bacterium]